MELALVLKRDVPANSEVTNDNLLDYVGGFTLANDVSARDLCFGAPMLQWFKGKGHRTFCPTGPILYLMDKKCCERFIQSETLPRLKWRDPARRDHGSTYL